MMRIFEFKNPKTLASEAPIVGFCTLEVDNSQLESVFQTMVSQMLEEDSQSLTVIVSSINDNLIPVTAFTYLVDLITKSKYGHLMYYDGEIFPSEEQSKLKPLLESNNIRFTKIELKIPQSNRGINLQNYYYTSGTFKNDQSVDIELQSVAKINEGFEFSLEYLDATLTW